MPLQNAQRVAFLMDASAVFFAVRDLYEDHQLDYAALGELLRAKSGARPNRQRTSPGSPDDIWAMWTSFHAQNTGQARFLDYAERTLGWSVRRIEPSDSYIIDPQTTLGISKAPDGGANRAVNRLIRFDAAIAYSIGRLAETHRIVLLSDSYALAEPLVRAAVIRQEKNFVAFFGRLLDPRWHGFLRNKSGSNVEFIDLDADDAELFGGRRTANQNLWEDNFPIR